MNYEEKKIITQFFQITNTNVYLLNEILDNNFIFDYTHNYNSYSNNIMNKYIYNIFIH